MVKRTWILGLTILACGSVESQVAYGQLIGNRKVGSAPGGIQQSTPGGRLGSNPSSFRTPTGGGGGFPQPSANPGNAGANNSGANNPGGLARQDSRFVRGNRMRDDFVGSNRSELRGFVGASQAVGGGTAPVGTNNVRIETGNTRSNRPLPPLGKSGMYYPRLDLNSMAEEDRELLANPKQFDRFRARVLERTNLDVDVSLESGVAVLRGEVASKRDSELLETMVGFEPGVERVRNELRIRQ